MVFKIQRFSLHDGPGIRTVVFFKGCPLRCFWCHNPEGQSFEKDIMFYASRCKMCGKCIEACPKKAIYFYQGRITTDLSKCIKCGRCVMICPNQAREVIGTEMDADEITDVVLKDMDFYEQSGGGVTISGGEPLANTQSLELLRRLKRENIHTAVETSGYCQWEYMKEAARHTDLFLYDLKAADNQKHIEYTGCSVEPIVDNLKKLSSLESEILVRIPLINGVNTQLKELEQMDNILKYCEIKKIQLLSYHDYAKNKYDALARNYQADNQNKLPLGTFAQVQEFFRKRNYEVGG